MKNGKKFPFDKLYMTNIGNPQPLGMKPCTFNRQTLSALINPSLINTTHISRSASKRAAEYLSKIPYDAVGM